MRGAVASRERVLQAPADATFRPDEQPEDAQRLLGPRDELDAHRERREQLEAELQALASLDDAAFPYSPGNADPASCLCCCGFKRLGQSYVLRERRVNVNGRASTQLVIVGPHWIGVVVTLGIILGATAAFLDQQCRLLPWYYSLLTLGFCSATVYYLYQTACTDPGIVRPKRGDGLESSGKAEVEEEEEDDVAVTVVEEEEEQAATKEPWSVASMSIQPPMRTRHCDLCGVEQTRDMEHCEDCGVCVAGYDHHCPWMGKCIGRDNMHAFKMFNIMWVAYVVFVLFVAIQNVDWGNAAVHQFHRTASGKWAMVSTRSMPPSTP